MCAFTDRALLKQFHAELDFKENIETAENSDILTASSPRVCTTDRDNPGRSGESHGGPGGLVAGNCAALDSRASTPVSRASTAASRASLSSRSASPLINLVEDDDDADEGNGDDGDAAMAASGDEEGLPRAVVAADGRQKTAGEAEDGRPPDAPLDAVAQLPRLRLNVTLASDPALQPYARDLKLSVAQAAEARMADDRALRPRSFSAGAAEPEPDPNGDVNVESDDEDEAPLSMVIDVRELVPPEADAGCEAVAVQRPMAAGQLKSPTVVTAVAGDVSSAALQHVMLVAAAAAAAAVPPVAPQPPPPPVQPPTPPPTSQMMTFTCDPCGIKFSSLSTLEAHQTYYCSHTRKDSGVSAPDDAPRLLVGGRKCSRSDSVAGESPVVGQWEHSSIPPDVTQKTPPIRSSTGRLYACSQCSYSADKKVSLNRHMRMHQSSPVAKPAIGQGGTTLVTSTSSSSGGSDMLELPADCYCSDCDIRFSSLKTYRAHKQHYCSARHRDGSTPTMPSHMDALSQQGHILCNNNNNNINGHKLHLQSPQLSPASSPASAPSSALQHNHPAQPPQPYLALPTNPIVIIPYALIRGASVLPGPMSSISPLNVPNPEHTCFVLANGLMQPIAQSLAMPIMASPSGRPRSRNGCSNAGHTEGTSICSPPPALASAGGLLPPTRPKSSASGASSATTRTRTPSTVSSSVVTLDYMASDSESVHGGETGRESADDRSSVRPEPTAPIALPATSAPLDLTVRHQPADLSSRSSRTLRSSLSSSQSLACADDDHSNTALITPLDLVERIVCAPSIAHAMPAHSPALSTSSATPMSLSSPRSSLNLSPPAVGCLFSSSQQTYMLRQMLPTDMMNRLVETGPLNRSAGTFGRRSSSVTANPRSRRSSSAVGNGPINPMAMLQQPSGHVLVKQGVSKCKECNIVFCKYENYLAHKKHYCSARHLPTADAEPAPNVGNATNDEQPGVATIAAYQQVVCVACGIKFSSLDNLSAHQMYYCPKRTDAAPVAQSACKSAQLGPALAPSNDAPAKRSTGSGSHYGAHHHQYKCPLCDVVSPNAGDAKRHLDTHAGVKAFRCAICRYRGNTMRGMRTHIRMHFDRKTAAADFNEEDYITCVLEENGVEVVQGGKGLREQQSRAAMAPVAKSAEGAAMHGCDECGYASVFKGNVVRHSKLVHGPVGYNRSAVSSPGLGEGGESLFLNGHNPQEASNAYSVAFKAEHLLTDQHQAKRIKLETLDDETTMSSTTSSSSTTTTTGPTSATGASSAFCKQPMTAQRRKSIVTVN